MEPSYYRWVDIKGVQRYAGSRSNYYVYGVYRFSMRNDPQVSYRRKYIRNVGTRLQIGVL